RHVRREGEQLHGVHAALEAAQPQHGPRGERGDRHPELPHGCRVETAGAFFGRAHRISTASPLLPRTVEHEPVTMPAWKRETPGEHRWPASVAMIGAIVLQVGLPQDMAPRPHYLLPAI